MARRRPPDNPQAHETLCVNLAMELAEQKLRDGTAPAPVITHFLKLGSSMAELEKARIECENQMLLAKAENLKTGKSVEEKIEAAMQAMRIYRGEAYEDTEI